MKDNHSEAQANAALAQRPREASWTKPAPVRPVRKQRTPLLDILLGRKPT